MREQPGLVSQLKGQQADYQKKSQQWLLASAKEYLEVADHPDKYGSYKRMDEVLFYLAYMLNQVKKEDAARKYFKRLIKDYPKSKFIPYAFLAFGDYFFDQKQLEDALKFYDKRHAVPRIADLRLREIQRGLGLLQPRRLQAGAGRRSCAVIELSNKGGAGGGSEERRRSRSARKRRRTRSAPTRASARRRRRGTSSVASAAITR